MKEINPTKRGRKTKLTPELTDRICSVLANGNYITTACAIARIHQRQFFRWMEKGEHESSGPYRKFYESVKEAEQTAELALLRDIRTDDSWQSKAWILERRFPERWGRKDRLQADVTGNVDVQFVPVQQLTVDEWRTQIESQ